MRPFDVKLEYLGRSWCTVKFELGHNELVDAEEPEYRISEDLVSLFTEIGLPAPRPVPVMRSDHQIAQKLHAVSSPGNDRAKDLVDLQLLDQREDLDLEGVAGLCQRLFKYRRQQPWPPTIAVGDQWEMLYLEASDGMDVLLTVDEAVKWTNRFIERIAAASPSF